MALYNNRTRDASGVTNIQVIAFIWSFWLRRKYTFAAACILTLIWTGLDLSLPIASSHLIATVASAPNGVQRVWHAWKTFIMLFAGYVVVRNVAFRLWSVIAARNMEAMTNEVFHKLQTAPSEWHASHAGGETIRRVVRAMWGYDAVTDAFTLWFGPSLVVLLGLSSVLCWRQPLAGIVALGAVLVFLTASVLLTVRYIRPANLRSNKRDAVMTGMLADALSANGVVKSFAAEGYEAARIAHATAEWRRSVLITWRRFIDMGLLQNVCLLVLLAGLSAAMLRAWTRETAGPGDVAFSITAFLMMSTYLRNVGENVRLLQRGFDDTSDAVALQRELTEHVEPPLRAERPARGEIVFENVGFTYSGTEQVICRNLSLHVKPGETVAIMGPSGTGKSTLVKLLQRLYEPQQGRILIDGTDATTMPLHTLRRSIAVAPQYPELFHRSVFDNIAYGRPSAMQSEVVAAARASCAHGFICELVQGYETVVGERGEKLSGGQRQRIALARAILTEAPIVVLDEITSALDADTEEAVLAAIRPRLAGRTCIVVTHRASTARFADRILHFADGQMQELSPPPVHHGDVCVKTPYTADLD